jgi:hypothetical protein
MTEKEEEEKTEKTAAYAVYLYMQRTDETQRWTVEDIQRKQVACMKENTWQSWDEQTNQWKKDPDTKVLTKAEYLEKFEKVKEDGRDDEADNKKESREDLARPKNRKTSALKTALGAVCNIHTPLFFAGSTFFIEWLDIFLNIGSIGGYSGDSEAVRTTYLAVAVVNIILYVPPLMYWTTKPNFDVELFVRHCAVVDFSQ